MLAACIDQPSEREALLALREGGFAIDDDAMRQAKALGLLACLGEHDPQIRDGVAFEALSKWLRADQIDAGTLQ